MLRPTELPGAQDHLDQLPIRALLEGMNEVDQTVPLAVKAAIPDLEKLVEALVIQLKKGGRLFYLGAGTSGRLGIVDASELPPTFGVSFDLAIGLIAGGDSAIRRAVEFAEDDEEQGFKDLQQYHVHANDFVIGIAASGTTPYVIGAMRACREANIPTGCITCNPNAPLLNEVDFPVVANTGPEFVTGSTRLKAGTAQKLMLNMISTTAMIQLGKVAGNKMVDMQLTNHKLWERAIRMVLEQVDCTEEEALLALQSEKSVRKAVAKLQEEGKGAKR